MPNIEKSRKHIEGGMRKNRAEIKTFQEKLDQDVKDKKKIAQVSRRLRGKGTTEGLKTIAAKGERAGRRVDEQSRKDHQELDRKAHKSAKQRETKLKDRARKDAQDAGDLRSIAGQVKQKGAKAELKQAASGAEKDRKYLETRKREQEKTRTASEKQARDKETRVRKTKPSFKR